MARWLLVLTPLALWLGGTSLYTVDAAEMVHLTQFGRTIAILDGGGPDAGLHAKLPWPIQAVQRLDRRLQAFEIPPAELLTRDSKGGGIDRSLTVDATVCWRIADVARFVRTVGTMEGAQRLLSQRVSSELGAAIGESEMDDLVSLEPGRVDRYRSLLRERLLDGGALPLRRASLDENGIEVVDVRLRRTNHPERVREAIFDRIRSERAKKAAEYSSEGERLAADIRSTAEREVSRLKAEAEARAIELRGQADAASDRIRNEAALADPRFYAFLRKLEEYQKILGDGRSTLLLSTHREMFDLLLSPPAPRKKEK
jgi:membrane protease subunit HflC